MSVYLIRSLSKYTCLLNPRFGRSIIKMSSEVAPAMDIQFSYEESIRTLDTLQSLTSTTVTEKTPAFEKNLKLQTAWTYLSKLGIGPEELKKLSVIHIAGTKGKGSTSALCESILRHHGYRTGLYISPHLVSVTERIQLDGQQISKEKFARYFTSVYQMLRLKQDFDGDMPPYFSFLTVLALNIFLREKVDVAVVEVGIGGQYDITNVVNNVVAAGITSLGLEHTAILGDTIEQIAREKGGIMKEGCTAYTIAHAQSTVLPILRNIALNRNCVLNVVPDFDSYTWESCKAPKMWSEVPALKTNASLAVQLAHRWMQDHKSQRLNVRSNVMQVNGKSGMTHDESDKLNGEDFINATCSNGFDDVNRDGCVRVIPRETAEAISSCVCPGRCQYFRDDSVDFYIDGAHTMESIQVGVDWFRMLARPSSTKVLIFNLTGDRDPKPLLKLLLLIGFNYAIFVPNVAFKDKKLIDQHNAHISKQDMLSRCRANLTAWTELLQEESVNVISSKVLGSLQEAVHAVNLLSESDAERPQVLVTGSLHLVGAALSVLDPDLKRSKNKS